MFLNAQKVSLTLLYLTVYFLHGHSQLIRGGRCPDVKVKQGFDLKKYLGTWYQRATFGTALFQGVGRCVTAQYTLNTTGRVEVFNTQEPVRGKSTPMKSIRGWAVLQEPSKQEAKLLVTFPLPVLGSITSPYWVLDTDYTSWALVYSCFDLRLLHIMSGWILTREQDLDKSRTKTVVEDEVSVALRSAGLSRSMFTDTDQDKCDVTGSPRH